MEAVMDHDEMMAAGFVADRVRHFTRLHKPIKKLVLNVVDYYLDLYFAHDSDARNIVEGIRNQPDEESMVELYKQFLEFLPVRLRAGIQGRYLFQEPSMSEKQLNAERLVARDIEAEKREEAEIMSELGLDTPEKMDMFKKIEALASSDEELSPEKLGALLSEMTGASVEEIEKLTKEIKELDLGI